MMYTKHSFPQIKTSAIYLDTPYTVQPGGCGDPGEYTHVTPNFLENLDGKTTDIF